MINKIEKCFYKKLNKLLKYKNKIIIIFYNIINYNIYYLTNYIN